MTDIDLLETSRRPQLSLCGLTMLNGKVALPVLVKISRKALLVLPYIPYSTYMPNINFLSPVVATLRCLSLNNARVL